MSKKANQKLKILYILKILMEKTDEEHPMSTSDIIKDLSSYGIEAERKSVYDDIDALCNFGIDIIKISSGANLYYIGERPLELPELKLLVDTVQSAKFITHKKSLELIKKLEKLTSQNNAKQLRRQVFVAGRVKTPNEQIFYNVDAIHLAMNQGKMISFKYFEWNTEKNQMFKRNGELYRETPLGLTWNEENYYLIAYSDERKKIIHFRVDKMVEIKILEEKAKTPTESFDTAKYTSSMFGMYGGEESVVTLRATKRLAGVFIDRFGKDITLIKDGAEHFIVNLKISVSPVFISWILGFGAEVQVISPKHLIEDVKNIANDIINLYK